MMETIFPTAGRRHTLHSVICSGCARARVCVGPNTFGKFSVIAQRNYARPTRGRRGFVTAGRAPGGESLLSARQVSPRRRFLQVNFSSDVNFFWGGGGRNKALDAVFFLFYFHCSVLRVGLHTGVLTRIGQRQEEILFFIGHVFWECARSAPRA